MNWKITECNWSKDYRWFLVDEGKIQYSFKDRKSAVRYRENGHLDYMLLTNLDRIAHETMLDPHENYCWSSKIQRCISLEEGK